MDPDVQQRHIALYVNEFTSDLGEDGFAAIDGSSSNEQELVVLITPVGPGGTSGTPVGRR